MKTYIEAQFTKQMPFVSSPEQRALVDAEAARNRMSRAAVIRKAIDAYFAGREEEVLGSADESEEVA